MLAAKAALAIRVDALGEDVNSDLGLEHRAKLESRMKMLEEGFVSSILVINFKFKISMMKIFASKTHYVSL